MPYAGFSPIIGSSFDSDAAQNYQWAQANQQTDVGNLNRLAQAQEAQNRYFQNVAQMQQSEVARQDRLAQTAQEEARRQASDVASMAQRRQEFGVNTELSKAQLEADKERYKFARDEKKNLENQTVDEIKNAATALAPQYNRAQTAMTDATAKWNKAQADINSIGHELLASDLLGVPNVTYDPKTMAFVPTIKNQSLTSLPPDVQKKVADAQAKVDAAKTDKQQEAIVYQRAADEIKNLHSQAGKYSLIPEQNDDGTWTLFSAHPKINKRFGGTGKKSSASATTEAPAGTHMPFWARPPSQDELSAGNALTAAVSDNSLAGGTAGGSTGYQFASPSETGTTAAAAPTPAPAAAPESANYGFTPQSASWTNNPRELLRGYGRAVNYFLAGRQGPQSPPLTLGGMASAAVGNPQQWLPPVPPGRVRVISPDGQTGTVPQAQLPMVLAAGFKPA